MKNPIGWFDIHVEDMARAQRFYETVLNIELSALDDPCDTQMEMKAFPSNMERYGATGCLVKMAGAPVGHNSVIVYFSCDDCATEEARVEAAGGKITQSKFSIGEYGFITMALDSEGNTFGLHSYQ